VTWDEYDWEAGMMCVNQEKKSGTSVETTAGT
jgi:hypothetical protein